jgi:hypothetical protein
MLFIQAVTYNIAEVDDGSCESYVDSTSCLSEPSTLNRESNKCYWDSDDNKCHYLEASNDLLRVVFVAVISAMWSAPIAIGVNWLVMTVLSAKSSLSATEEKTTKFKTHSIMIDMNHIDKSNKFTSKQLDTQSVEDELRDLNNAIIDYKKTLSDTEQREYTGIILIYCLLQL